jgi:hypothetical protein
MKSERDAITIPSRFTSRTSNYCIHLIPVNCTYKNHTNITLTRCSISYMFRLLTPNLRENNYHEVIMLMSVNIILNTAPLNCYLQTIFRISTIYKNVVRLHIGLKKKNCRYIQTTLHWFCTRTSTRISMSLSSIQQDLNPHTVDAMCTTAQSILSHSYSVLNTAIIWLFHGIYTELKSSNYIWQ